MAQRYYLTDLGEGNHLLTAPDGESMDIGRYAVWEADNRGSADVVKTSNDLAALATAYGLDPASVRLIKRDSAAS